jgi:hypothetical protein
MLRRASSFKTTHTRTYKPKSTTCLQCGKLISYTTCPRWYCEACKPRSPSRTLEAHRLLSQMRRELKREPAELEPALILRPGFCRRGCGTRLSRENHDGICDGCHDEAALAGKLVAAP